MFNDVITLVYEESKKLNVQYFSRVQINRKIEDIVLENAKRKITERYYITIPLKFNLKPKKEPRYVILSESLESLSEEELEQYMDNKKAYIVEHIEDNTQESKKLKHWRIIAL